MRLLIMLVLLSPFTAHAKKATPKPATSPPIVVNNTLTTGERHELEAFEHKREELIAAINVVQAAAVGSFNAEYAEAEKRIRASHGMADPGDTWDLKTGAISRKADRDAAELHARIAEPHPTKSPPANTQTVAPASPDTAGNLPKPVGGK